MSADTTTPEPPPHRRLAIDANNSTWDHLGGDWSTLGGDDLEDMTERAYAAAYHWRRAEGRTIANDARAAWLLSKVWLARGNGELSLHYATRCLGACEQGGLGDFDLAYAHDAIGRAHACRGDLESARRHRDAAAAVAIADDEDRAQVESDLAAGPWFGA